MDSENKKPSLSIKIYFVSLYKEPLYRKSDLMVEAF